jgi:hypothetical protein
VLCGRPDDFSNFKKACNSLHTKKLRRPARKSQLTNITESRSPESTKEL